MPLLLLFIVAMILADLGGNMYGPLEVLYLKDLGAGIGQIGLFLLPLLKFSRFLISKAVPQRLRGVAFGLLSTSLGLVSLPAPMIGGTLWEKVNPQVPFILTAIVSLLCLIPAWFKFKITGNVDDEQPEMHA